MATGPIQTGDTVTVATSQIIRGAKQFANQLAFVPKATQTLAATAPIVANDSVLIRVAGSGGAVTLTSAPTIADGTPGQIIVLVGTHNTNTVTIQDVANLAGSNVDMGGVDRTLGSGDYLVLCFNDDNSIWEEIVFKNN